MIIEKRKWWGPLALPSLIKESTLHFTTWRSKPVVVVRVGDQLIVFANKCPHQSAAFNGGTCLNGEVTCPMHNYRFRVTDGIGLSSPGQNLELYPAEEREDGVYVATEYLTLRIFGFDLW